MPNCSVENEISIYVLTYWSLGDVNLKVWSQNICYRLTHWGRVTHTCVSKLTIIGSDNGLSPGRRQAIIWTNAGILSIGPLGTNLNEMLIVNHTFPFKKMRLKISSAKWRPSCLDPNVLSSWTVSTSCENSLRWMPQNTFYDMLTLVQVMACVQAITRANIDPDLCRHVTSQDHNELNRSMST